MSKFLHDNDDNDNNKAIAIPWVFSENSQAKKCKKGVNSVNPFPNKPWF